MKSEWAYLSFCNTLLPEGTRFLGGCYVKASTRAEALSESQRLTIFPDGANDIVVAAIVPRFIEAQPAEVREKLLTKSEILAGDDTYWKNLPPGNFQELL